VSNDRIDATLVAVAADEVVGELHVESTSFGFGEIGIREKHLRRANGELWDLIDMGLQL
jgi:hypothetical protein